MQPRQGGRQALMVVGQTTEAGGPCEVAHERPEAVERHEDPA
jgi:hypothetical protein